MSRFLQAGLASGVLLLALPAAAQPYPAKPVRVIVPYAPGGGTDLTARVVGAKLSEALGQPVVVENRPGGAGMIGAELVAKAAPDGYTVLLATPAEMAINPHLFAKMPYQPDRDFAPVTLAVSTPLILVVHPALPAQTVKALIALARAQPGRMTSASAGTGGVQHMALELLKMTAKVDIIHVPYKGAGPAIPDLIGGHVDLFFSGMPPAMAQVKAGKLRALAVTTPKRSPAASDVPTMAEAGVPGFDINNWFAYFVPAGTPADVVGRINAEINKALRLQDVKDRLSPQGAETVGTTPEELARYVRAESDKYAKLIRASGAKVD